MADPRNPNEGGFGDIYYKSWVPDPRMWGEYIYQHYFNNSKNDRQKKIDGQGKPYETVLPATRPSKDTETVQPVEGDSA